MYLYLEVIKICTHPLIRDNTTGRITSLEKWLRWKNAYEKYNSRTVKQREAYLKELLKKEKATLLPCGKCVDCRLAYSRGWANRMEMELAYHEDNWFLTLTYDNEHVPHNYKVDEFTGEILIENLTLVPKDLQDFLKRLRRNIDYHKRGDSTKMMYYCCGEYGDKTHRPHYHGIIYDLPIKADELKELKRKNGAVYYTCPWLEKVWGKGNIILAPVEWESCAYVARYIMKKQKGPDAKKYYENLGIEPEFVRMSLKPAIGARYYEEHADEIYSKDTIYLKNGKTCKPPRYFDKSRDAHNMQKELEASKDHEEVLTKMESDEMREIKRRRRKIANDNLFAELRGTSNSLEDYFKIKEQKRIESAKKLLRPDN